MFVHKFTGADVLLFLQNGTVESISQVCDRLSEGFLLPSIAWLSLPVHWSTEHSSYLLRGCCGDQTKRCLPLVYSSSADFDPGAESQETLCHCDVGSGGSCSFTLQTRPRVSWRRPGLQPVREELPHTSRVFPLKTWQASGLWFLQHFSSTPKVPGALTLGILKNILATPAHGLGGPS